MLYKPNRHAQLARFGLGIEHHPSFFQNPRLDAFVVDTQQIQRAHLGWVGCEMYPSSEAGRFGQTVKASCRAMRASTSAMASRANSVS